MKILIGLSGGVDSAVAAKLLLDQGHEVAGITMQLLPAELKNIDKQKQDIEDARLVADKLGIKYFLYNLQTEFKELIIDYFINEYKNGNTPNPCFICNKKIKFGLFLKKAMELGFDAIATGHYAVIEKNNIFGKERFLLKRSLDNQKDQSYFLALLNQDQFSKTIFPLASYTKDMVRSIAEKTGLLNAHRPDSQDICFVSNDYTDVINLYAKDFFSEGTFLDIYGKEIGRHKGLQYYTIGQRRGLAIAMGYPVYAVKKNAADNTVTVGCASNLFAKSLIAEKVNWIAFDKPEQEISVNIKTRYRQTEKSAKLIPLTDHSVNVVFDQPEKAVAEGQAAVFYKNDYILGGGIISSVERIINNS